jgi:hypothetical protein
MCRVSCQTYLYAFYICSVCFYVDIIFIIGPLMIFIQSNLTVSVYKPIFGWMLLTAWTSIRQPSRTEDHYFMHLLTHKTAYIVEYVSFWF